MNRNIEDYSLFKERQKRKQQKEKREKNKEKAALRATLMSDLTAALSEKGITIKNVTDIIDYLIKRGWIKKEFMKRKWS